MSAARFCCVNELSNSVRDTTHGGGGSYDDPSGNYPIANVWDNDRRLLWKSDGTANMVLVFDATGHGSMACGFVALLAVSKASGGTLTSCAVDLSADGVGWINVGTISIDTTASRDFGIKTGVGACAYLRLRFTNTGVITVGKIFVSGGYSLGTKEGSPGSEDTVIQNRVEQQLVDGSTNVNILGFPGRTVVLLFKSLTGSERDVLRYVASDPDSIVLFDAEDNVMECVVSGGQVKTVRTFVDTYDCTLTLTRLP
jgi:hypothetical protein